MASLKARKTTSAYRFGRFSDSGSGRAAQVWAFALETNAKKGLRATATGHILSRIRESKI
jgi:hypothetical protein